MNTFLQKIKLFERRFQKTKISYKKEGINPKRDWGILIVVAFVALCIVGGVAFYFYTQIDQGKFFGAQESSVTKEIKIDTSLLKKTVDDINLRESLFRGLKSSPSSPDPSL